MFRHMAPVALAALIAASFPLLAQSQVSDPKPISALGAPVTQPGVSPPLSLAEAIELAIQFSPQRIADQKEYEASEGEIIQAGARPNPEVQALIEDTRRETRTTTLQISQPIELGGKRASRLAAAEHGRAQAALDLDVRLAKLRADVTDAFFTAAIAQERVRLAQAGTDLAARATDAATKRVQAGKVSPVEETRAKVAQAGIRVELAQAQSELRSASNRLGTLLGSAASRAKVLTWSPNELPPAAQQGDWDGTVQDLAAIDHLPSVRRARLEVSRRRALAELAQAQQVPDLTVTLGAKRPEELGRTQAVVGLAFPLPLTDTNRGNVLQALRLVDKAEAELDATRLEASARWQSLIEQQRAARLELDVLQKEVMPGAESAWKAAVTGFELGKFSFLESLDAQRTLLQARTQYLRVLQEFYRVTSDLQRLLGEAVPGMQAALPSRTRSSPETTATPSNKPVLP